METEYAGRVSFRRSHRGLHELSARLRHPARRLRRVIGWSRRVEASRNETHRAAQRHCDGPGTRARSEGQLGRRGDADLAGRAAADAEPSGVDAALPPGLPGEDPGRGREDPALRRVHRAPRAAALHQVQRSGDEGRPRVLSHSGGQEVAGRHAQGDAGGLARDAEALPAEDAGRDDAAGGDGAGIQGWRQGDFRLSAWHGATDQGRREVDPAAIRRTHSLHPYPPTVTYSEAVSVRGGWMRELADYAMSILVAIGAVGLCYWAIVYLAH